jgi:L,D-peptidoglycan transpeptidase YkuD (ErfK/YbiS/YcfS/YnhG family)
VSNKINKDCGKSHALPPIIVRRKAGTANTALLAFQGLVFPVILGRTGGSVLKREGDGATPRARMKIVAGYYRADRVRLPRTGLAMTPIRTDMGWCDVPGHACYNRLVRMPFAGSHERMLRADRLYDICLVLDWNITERRRHRGSAIFWHLTHPQGWPTEGCIAIDPAAMRRLLPFLRKDMPVQVL